MFPWIILAGLGYFFIRSVSESEGTNAAAQPAGVTPASRQLPAAQRPAAAPSTGVPIEVAIAIAYETDAAKLEELAKQYDGRDQVVAALIRQRAAFLRAVTPPIEAATSVFRPLTEQQAAAFAAEQQAAAFAAEQQASAFAPGQQASAFAPGQQASAFAPGLQASAFAPLTAMPENYRATAAVSGYPGGDPRPPWLPAYVAWPPAVFNPTFHGMG